MTFLPNQPVTTTRCWPCLAVTVTVLLAGLAISASGLQAQTQKRYVIKDSRELMPRELGIGLPDGPVVPHTAENVATTDENGRGCVARVHVQVGDNFIVLLPDGQLVGRTADKVNPTDRPFEPASIEAVGREIVQDRLTGFQTLVTDRFVFVYNTTPEFAKVTATVMETMLTGVIEHCRAQGLEVHEPEVPLPVIMFHRVEQFQAYSSNSLPSSVLAYYEIASNRVILHESSSLMAVDRELARQELLSTIAHEGAHQILHNIGVQQRLSRWPMWLGEGIAEYLAPTKPGLKFAWKGAGKLNNLRMWELESFLQKQYIKGFNGDTVDQTVLAGQLDSTGYASAWTITHYLAEKHREDFDRYMRYLSRMPPLQGMVPDPGATRPVVPGNMVHFKKFFTEDLEAFENEMVTFMSKQKFDSPFGNYPHFVCTVEIPDVDGVRKHACFYLDKGSVQEWQGAVVESLNATEKKSARFELRQFRNRGEANRYIKSWKRKK